METKNILIALVVAIGGVGAYLYFNNKNSPRSRPRNSVTTDTTDTTNAGTSGGTSGGGTGVLTEEEMLIISCNNVGGTYTTDGCILNDSPNPRTPTDSPIGGSGTSGNTPRNQQPRPKPKPKPVPPKISIDSLFDDDSYGDIGGGTGNQGYSYYDEGYEYEQYESYKYSELV